MVMKTELYILVLAFILQILKHMSLNKQSFLFTGLLTFCFFSLSLLGILHHEIWLDEAHSFILSRDSSSFWDLIVNTRQEGHPMIWYILLWLITKVSHAVWSMQVLHIFITTLSVFLMARYAPFGKIKQVLFAFSYFFFYEYNIISRNYALGILFVTWYAVLMCRERKNYVLIAFVLMLLANSHFIGLILSIPLALVCFLEMKQEKRTSSLLLTLAILFTGLVLGILQILPQEDSIFSHLPKPAFFSIDRMRAFTVPFKAFYHFPDLREIYTWNTNIFTANKLIGTFLALIFPFLLIKAFGSRPLSLLIIVLSSLGICLFFYTELMYNYTVRHWGYIFLAYYAAVWLQYGLDQSSYTKYLNKLLPSFFTKDSPWVSQSLFYSTLILQVSAAGYAYTLDLRKNFCNSKEAAEYIQHHHYENELLILSSFTSGAAVSAYLDKPLYYPEYKGWGSYAKWNIRTWEIDKAELLKQIHALNKNKQAYLLMSDKSLNPSEPMLAGQLVFQDRECSIAYVTTFDDGIINHEKFELYKVIYQKR